VSIFQKGIGHINLEKKETKTLNRKFFRKRGRISFTAWGRKKKKTREIKVKAKPAIETTSLSLF